MYHAHRGEPAVFVTWRRIMPRTDLLDQSATRVELDQRSREARLRLERVERLLVVRPTPVQSLLRRVLKRLGSRIYVVERGKARSPKSRVTRGRRQTNSVPGRAGGAGRIYAAPPAPWPACSRRAAAFPFPAERANRTHDDRPDRHGFEPWLHWCRRRDLNFR